MSQTELHDKLNLISGLYFHVRMSRHRRFCFDLNLVSINLKKAILWKEDKSQKLFFCFMLSPSAYLLAAFEIKQFNLI